MFKPSTLLFGTAGIPLSTTPRDTIKGIERVRSLGLEAMELEFVRSINITKQKAPFVAEAAKKNNIVLTCHAPYFINLATNEKSKLEASALRILNSARISFLCKAWSVCFHPGFYQKQDQKKVYEKIKQELKSIIKILKNENVEIWLRPETTGKPTAFGDLKECLMLSQEIDNILPCIDFAHLHARTNKQNSYSEFREQLVMVEKYLGKDALNNMHIHISGIKYSLKGEQHHLNIKQSDFNVNELIKVWKEFKIKGVVISESPNIEGDAIYMKKIFLH